ncbi:hypothetical protein [Luteimonas sp. SDU82]|uniref:hypothetical protein n=1 Tax=Luteimonas sp. SDU82 TaxID=3422592 RepID=UPI003EBDEDB5
MTLETTLYLVYLEAGDASPAPDPSLRPLAQNLYLAESTRNRSQLYHALKRRLQPRRLLVAALDGDPKFKDMQPGTHAWLRARHAR